MQIIARWHGIVLCGMILLSAIQSKAANYFYNPSRGSGASWHEANAWSTSGFDGPFDQTWVDGNTANFKFSVTKLVSLMGQNVTVAGIVNSGAASSVAITSTTGADLTFLDNAPIQGNTLQFGWTGSGKVTLRGPLTASCGLTLREMIETVGMVTLTAGTCQIYPQAMGSNAVFRLAGGNLNLANVDTYVTQSPIQIDSGSLVIGYYNATPIDVTIPSLSGSGGTVAARVTVHGGASGLPKYNGDPWASTRTAVSLDLG